MTLRVQITHQNTVYTLEEELADYVAGRVNLGGLLQPIPLDALIELVDAARVVAERSEPRNRVYPSGDVTGATDSAAVTNAVGASLTHNMRYAPLERSGEGHNPFLLQGILGERSARTDGPLCAGDVVSIPNSAREYHFKESSGHLAKIQATEEPNEPFVVAIDELTLIRKRVVHR